MGNAIQSHQRSALYRRDYYAWALEQASALRKRRFEALDLENLSEEVEGLARSERRELRNRLMRVLVHLLKCQFQPKRRTAGWETTLFDQRAEIADLLHDSPSLRRELRETIDRAYAVALQRAGKEIRVKPEMWKGMFPARCPWSAEQILDQDFYPPANK